MRPTDEYLATLTDNTREYLLAIERERDEKEEAARWLANIVRITRGSRYDWAVKKWPWLKETTDGTN